MPKVKHIPPKFTREKGQRSIEPFDVMFNRIVPQWRQPSWQQAKMWRQFVQNQPMLTDARDTLISQFLSFDWKIEPVDSDKRDELKSEIRYYTDFFTYTGEYDYTEIVDWIGGDILDIPFGAAAEVGRQGDNPNGKVLWLEPLDGGTLFPTQSNDWPVGQAVQGLPLEPVFFPKHAIDRIYFSPRRELQRKGWGMAPPEKIYLAAQMLNYGDQYYYKLLLDTPEAGILDLGDMAQTSAEEWVKAFKDLLGGVDPYKIPVLYEHNNEVKWIPFTRPPEELMYDKVTTKYASLVLAAYGMSLSDIGFQAVASGGETLAGSIRQERRTRRTGLAKLKKKMAFFFNRLLPPTLRFHIIDLDDEVSVAVSRSRLANATAGAQLIDMGVFTNEEWRRQMIADGTMTISLPENPPKEAQPSSKKPAERPSMLGRPVAPSAGGQGEVRGDYFSDELDRITNIEPVRLRRLIRAAIEPIAIETKSAYSQLPWNEMGWWSEWHNKALWGNLDDEIPEFTLASINAADGRIKKAMEGDTWWMLDIDNTLLLDEFKGLFNEARAAELQHRAEIAYEKGETDKLDIEIEPDTELETKFLDELSHGLDDIKSNWEADIRKYVISGVRNALSSGEVATFFDETLDNEKILHDNSLVDYVRLELQNAKHDLTNKFAEVITNKIKMIMEEV